MSRYAEVQERVLKRLGVEQSPASLIDCWEQLVGECEDCYDWDISEFDNDARARALLEALLTEPELQAFDEHKQLVNRVALIDDRLRHLLIPGAWRRREGSWWERGILRRAGPAYARSVGVEVRVC